MIKSIAHYYFSPVVNTYRKIKEWYKDAEYDYPSLHTLLKGFIVLGYFVLGAISLIVYISTWIYIWPVGLALSIISAAFVLGLIAKDC